MAYAFSVKVVENTSPYTMHPAQHKREGGRTARRKRGFFAASHRGNLPFYSIHPIIDIFRRIEKAIICENVL